MKLFAPSPAIILALAAFGTSLLASPLDKGQVSADAKWVLHLDMDEFKTTKLGTFVTTDVLDKKLAKPKDDLKRELNFDLRWDKIRSVTGYGSQFQTEPDRNGVLLVKADLEVEKALEAAMAKPELAGVVQKLEAAPAALYSIANQVYVAVERGHLFIVSKSKDAVQKAREVMAGKAPNIATSKAFSGYGETPKTFFFLGLAEGLKDQTIIPPQAQVLKNAEAGRVVLGEKAENLFLQVTLKAKSVETAQQIQQVAQGFIALAVLSQAEHPELQELAQAAKVTAENDTVTLRLEYGVAGAIKQIQAQN